MDVLTPYFPHETFEFKGTHCIRLYWTKLQLTFAQMHKLLVVKCVSSMSFLKSHIAELKSYFFTSKANPHHSSFLSVVCFQVIRCWLLSIAGPYFNFYMFRQWCKPSCDTNTCQLLYLQHLISLHVVNTCIYSQSGNLFHSVSVWLDGFGGEKKHKYC